MINNDDDDNPHAEEIHTMDIEQLDLITDGGAECYIKMSSKFY